MDAADLFLAVEVGKGAGDAERPVIAARAQGEGIGGVAEQREPGRLGRGDLIEQRPVAFGVGADALAAEFRIAFGLDDTGKRDATPHLGAAL